jgi:transposase InsO family protein
MDRAIRAAVDGMSYALRTLPAVHRGRLARCEFASPDGVHPAASVYRAWWEGLSQVLRRTGLASNQRCLVPRLDGASYAAAWRDALWARLFTAAPHDRGNPSRDPHSQASLRTLASRHGINPKTVAKWHARQDVTDRRTGPAEPRSTTLSAEAEAIVVAFRRHTLLPLDDCLSALQPTILHLTRSALHRCLKRHGISRLPETDGDKPARKRFNACPIGFFHIDIAEVRTEQGKLYLFVTIDRTSKFAFAQLHERATQRIGADVLRALLKAVPYRVHTLLADNGIHFTAPGNVASAAPLIRQAMGRGEIFRAHAFELACAQDNVEHRLTKPHDPWTNGQVERMNRTLKQATVQRYHYSSHDELRGHLGLFLDAHNYARRLKTLKGLTPYEAICRWWANAPDSFTANPHHEMPGPNS